ncbi:MAG: dockerin type I domain-containing protein [Sedimentisphaerales bacterium]|jgi:hypothetical protein
MEKLSKWVLATIVMMSVFVCGMVNFASAKEWDDIPYIQGHYSRIYFDFTVDGNTGTFYCINDWMNNNETDVTNGGLLSNPLEFNSFPFKIINDQYEIRIYPTGSGKLYKNGHPQSSSDPCEPNYLPGFQTACCWTTSPNMPITRHTIWEFKIPVQGWKAMKAFSACDPKGMVITVYNPAPPDTPAIVTSGPSKSHHVIDGRFTDDSAACEPPPTPPRSYQAPVRDPFFNEQDGGQGWTLEFDANNGGVRVNTKKISAYEQFTKWSQPPEEVNNSRGIFNGWDEVSILDSNSNCWNCRTQTHGDADCDGHVGPLDMAILVAAFNTHHGDPNYNPCADFNRDGYVNTLDQAIMMTYWNTNPPANSPLSKPIVADDWVCMDNRPITDIHWWGSFKGWTACTPPNNAPKAFRLGIWTDVPNPNHADPNKFSHPGRLIWENICSSYTWSYAGDDLDPRGIEHDEACFKFDMLLSQNQWFSRNCDTTNGTVYWLSIAAIYDSCQPEPNHPWGWKTRPHFYNDDAVRITDVNSRPLKIGSLWVSGEPIKYPAGTSWDMAFALTTSYEFPPMPYQEKVALPSWPPIPPEPNMILLPAYKYRFDIDRNGIINLKDFVYFAEAYLAQGRFWPEPNTP